MTTIEFNYMSLEAMNDAQKQAIIRIADGDTVEKLVISGGAALSLPSTYLAFRTEHRVTGTSIYGGIDPEGNVST